MDPTFAGYSQVVFTLAVEPVTTLTLAGVGVLAFQALVKFTTTELAKRTPQTMRRIKAYLLGKNILILGRPAAGKTSFLNYLKEGKLPNERPSTSRTYKPNEAKAFTFNKQGEFEIKVKKGMDVPGLIEIKDQLELLRARKPDMLLVFISLAPVTDRNEPYRDRQDAKLWNEESKWLLSFSNELKSIVMGDKILLTKLKAVLFILNKEDLIERETVTARRRQVSEALDRILKPALQENFDRMEVITCSLYGRATADEVVIRIYRALFEKIN
jgi:ribosome biogenesis GTPase A